MEEEAQTANGSAWKRRLRIVLVLIIALYGIGWAAANVVLNSGRAKQKIGSRVESMMGAPLEIGRVSVTPLGTLLLKDLRIDVRPPADSEVTETSEEKETVAPPPLFAGRELRVKVGLLSLLTKSIRVKNVRVSEPVFSLVRAADGRFLLPAGFGSPGAGEEKVEGAEPKPEGAEPGGTPMAGAGGTPPGGTVPMVQPGGAMAPLALPPELVMEFDKSKTGPEGAQEVPVPLRMPAPGGEEESVSTAQAAETVESDEPRPIVIRYGEHDIHFGDIEMRRGLVQVLTMNSKKDLLRVEDMEMRVALGEARASEGSFTAKKAVLFGMIEVESLRAKVEMQGLLLQFSEFEADLADGKLEGAFKTSPFIAGFPFLANLEAQGVSMPALSSEIVSELGIDAGALEGRVDAIGLLRSPETYQARGELRVDGAHVDKIGLLAPLSGSIDFKGIEDIHFDEMALRFSVLGGNVRFDDVRVSSPDIVMSGRGFVGFSGQISLAWRLYVNETAYHAIRMIEARLPEGMGMGYQPFGNGERYYRDYLIAGYVSKPVINFWRVNEGVLMDDLRAQIGQLLTRPERK